MHATHWSINYLLWVCNHHIYFSSCIYSWHEFAFEKKLSWFRWLLLICKTSPNYVHYIRGRLSQFERWSFSSNLIDKWECFYMKTNKFLEEIEVVCRNYLSLYQAESSHKFTALVLTWLTIMAVSLSTSLKFMCDAVAKAFSLY